VNDSKSSRAKFPPGDTAGNERRRIAKFVHDDRGNVTLEWEVAPANHERPVLEIVQDSPSALAPGHEGNPYDRPTTTPPKSRDTTRTNLRTLSEWIKLVREVERRKQESE
jgi:hypothetical protein